MKFRFTATTALFASLFSLSASAATFNFPNSTTSVNENQFNRAVDRAGNGGTITFPSGTVNISGSLVIDRPNITVRGRGSNRTRLVHQGNGVVRHVFFVNAAGVELSNLNIQGRAWPAFGPALSNDFPYENQLADQEGAAPISGVDSGVRITGRGVDFSIRNCRIRRVSNGIRYTPNALPSGLLARDCQFTTNRAMFWMTDAGNAVPSATGPLARRFVIDNCDFIDEAGRGVASCGIYWDYGNTLGETARTINLRDSVIRNCTIPKMAKWSISFARASHLRIINNDLGGGGEHGDFRFIHPLHFEDEGDRRRPIIISNNRLNQDTRTNGRRLELTSHIWSGADGNRPRPVLRIDSNNTYSGISRNLVRVR